METILFNKLTRDLAPGYCGLKDVAEGENGGRSKGETRRTIKPCDKD